MLIYFRSGSVVVPVCQFLRALESSPLSRTIPTSRATCARSVLAVLKSSHEVQVVDEDQLAELSSRLFAFLAVLTPNEPQPILAEEPFVHTLLQSSLWVTKHKFVNVITGMRARAAFLSSCAVVLESVPDAVTAAQAQEALSDAMVEEQSEEAVGDAVAAVHSQDAVANTSVVVHALLEWALGRLVTPPSVEGLWVEHAALCTLLAELFASPPLLDFACERDALVHLVAVLLAARSDPSVCASSLLALSVAAKASQSYAAFLAKDERLLECVFSCLTVHGRETAVCVAACGLLSSLCACVPEHILRHLPLLAHAIEEHMKCEDVCVPVLSIAAVLTRLDGGEEEVRTHLKLDVIVQAMRECPTNTGTLVLRCPNCARKQLQN